MIKAEHKHGGVGVLMNGTGDELIAELTAIVDAFIAHFDSIGNAELGATLVALAVASSHAADYIGNRQEEMAAKKTDDVDISDLLKAAQEEAEGK